MKYSKRKQKGKPPLKAVKKNGLQRVYTVKDTLVCANKKCILRKITCTRKGRDSVSASTILQSPFPVFNSQLQIIPKTNRHRWW